MIDERKVFIVYIIEILKRCILQNTDIEKIALLAYSLLLCNVNPDNELLLRAKEIILSEMQDDYAWINTYDTSLCAGVLSYYDTHKSLIEKIHQTLVAWRKEGCWGRTLRDKPRLMCTADVLMFTQNNTKYLSNNTCKEIICRAESMWRNDFEEAGYLFKARSYLDIAYVLKEYADKELVDKTLQLISRSQMNTGAFQYAHKTSDTQLDLLEQIRLALTLKKWSDRFNPEQIQRLEKYLKETVNIKSSLTSYSFVCFYNIYISGEKYEI